MILLNISHLTGASSQTLKEGTTYPLEHLSFNQLTTIIGINLQTPDQCACNHFNYEFNAPGCPTGILSCAEGLFITLDWYHGVKQLDPHLNGSMYICNQVYQSFTTYACNHHRRQKWCIIPVTDSFIKHMYEVYHLNFTSFKDQVIKVGIYFVDCNDGHPQISYEPGKDLIFKYDYDHLNYGTPQCPDPDDTAIIYHMDPVPDASDITLTDYEQQKVLDLFNAPTGTEVVIRGVVFKSLGTPI